MIDELFILQKDLREEILKNWPEESDEDRNGAMFIALLQEFGEMLQNWRGFKYWSNKKGHPIVSRVVWDKKGLTEKVNPFLEEAVDALHFFLELAIHLNARRSGYHYTDAQLREIAAESFGIQIDGSAHERDVFGGILEIYQEIAGAALASPKLQRHKLKRAFLLHMALIKKVFGFTDEQILKEFQRKHKENMKRQENGY